jgi:3-hydroxymyristoyl/3-hydroxydecanoyl-(acyl carrier protein) dehydratase
VSQLSPEPKQLFDADIKRILPHRYPFLLVDRVTELVPGIRIAGTKYFSIDDDAGRGHFPDSPLVPAGIVMEVVTQLGAILVLERPEMLGKVAVILQIPSARLLGPIRPGDTLEVQAEVLKLRESFGELRGLAYRDGVLIAEGHMRFGIANAADLLPANRPATP